MDIDIRKMWEKFGKPAKEYWDKKIASQREYMQGEEWTR